MFKQFPIFLKIRNLFRKSKSLSKSCFLWFFVIRLAFGLLPIKTFQWGSLSVSLVRLEMLPIPFSRSASQALICIVEHGTLCLYGLYSACSQSGSQVLICNMLTPTQCAIHMLFHCTWVYMTVLCTLVSALWPLLSEKYNMLCSLSTSTWTVCTTVQHMNVLSTLVSAALAQLSIQKRSGVSDSAQTKIRKRAGFGWEHFISRLVGYYMPARHRAICSNPKLNLVHTEDLKYQISSIRIANNCLMVQ